MTYVEKLLDDNLMFGLACFVYVLHSWFILSTKYNVDHCLCFTQSSFYQKDISMLIAISIARFPGRTTFIRPTFMFNGEVWTHDRSLSSFRCHCRTKINDLLLQFCNEHLLVLGWSWLCVKLSLNMCHDNVKTLFFALSVSETVLKWTLQNSTFN